MVGIGGYGMRGLARLFAGMGRRVSGSDAMDNPSLAMLRAEGIDCRIGEGCALCLPDDAAFVVYSAAVPPDHPERVAARERDLPCFKYAEALGVFCRRRHVIACAGTHGKSTCAAMMAFLLKQAGVDAGYLVGADPADGMSGFSRNARLGDPMVLEACEYDRSFLNLHPKAALITNVELEHVDCFPSEDSLREAFQAFIQGMPAGGVVVLPEEARRFLRLDGQSALRVVTFGDGGHWTMGDRETGPAGQRFVLHGPEGRPYRLTCPLPGRHNAENMAGVFVLARILFGGRRIGRALQGMYRYKGLARRLEVKFRGRRVVIDDYAHHPTEVRAVLSALRESFPGVRRWTAVFQPHQIRRLRTFTQEFVSALSLGDAVTVTPVFAARERDADPAREARAFLDCLHKADVPGTFCPDLAAARAHLTQTTRSGDGVVCLGAGDITQLAVSLAGDFAAVEDNHGQEKISKKVQEN